MKILSQESYEYKYQSIINDVQDVEFHLGVLFYFISFIFAALMILVISETEFLHSDQTFQTHTFFSLE